MMVKGISRQVIVVDAPNEKLFEQAIFIIKDGAPEVTEAQLMEEANRLIQHPKGKRKWCYRLQELFLIGAGATAVGVVWLITLLF